MSQPSSSHFGDILSPQEFKVSFPASFKGTTPIEGLERIILSANGNLQRLMSAYYNSSVGIAVIKNARLPDGNTWERVVTLNCQGRVFCKAVSTIRITSPAALKLVTEEKVGIGQLFFYMKILPSFKLLSCGRNENPISDIFMWRIYLLTADGIECKIKEEFYKNMLEIPQAVNREYNANAKL